MLIKHIPGLLFKQKTTWLQLRDGLPSSQQLITTFLLPMAAIAPVAAYFGTTQIGWSITGSGHVRLTALSALKLSVAYFIGIVVATLTVARFIQWMSETYGAEKDFDRCLALAAFSATPLYLCGALQIYPVIWLNYIFGLPLFAYSIFLLYNGIEHLLEVPRERAFLFGSAVLLVGLVAFVGLLAATVVLWGIGVSPEYADSLTIQRVTTA